METLSLAEARRLALFRAGLLPPATGSRSPRAACHEVLADLGYVQLDTISIAGARAHALAFLSRVPGLEPDVAESLLQPGAPLFEYWGHEASWITMDLYPLFGFRRRAYRDRHPWWGPVLAENRKAAAAIKRRIRAEGPLRSADFAQEEERSDWGFTRTKRILHALWSSGELAIRERRQFHRRFDLTERVVPDAIRAKRVSTRRAVRELLERALAIHGWAERRTLVGTWRLGPHRVEVEAALRELEAGGRAVRAKVVASGHERSGWVRPDDLEVAARVAKLELASDDGVLLSPFDPMLWDRPRVHTLFRFDHVLEVYKPAPVRKYGYFCLPVLAGDSLVARCDLKADRAAGRLHVLSARFEAKPTSASRRAVRGAITRYSEALGLRLSMSGLR